MRKIKVSEMPIVSSLVGLFTIGVNSSNESVKVSLEFVEDAADEATAAAATATTAAGSANTAATAADTAAASANTKAALADTAAANADTKAALANSAASSATSAASSANSAATNASNAATEAYVSADEAEEAAADADTAAAAANAAAAAVQAYMNTFLPTGLTVTAPESITYGNIEELYVVPALTPSTVQKNLVFISDNQAVSVSQTGRITVLAIGHSTVYVVPTHNAAIAKAVQIAVVPPAMRLAATASLRFCGASIMRLT